MISAVCQGLLSCRRHIGKREDPGDEVASTDIRNILVRSNSEAPVIDFPKKLLDNPMNISAT